MAWVTTEDAVYDYLRNGRKQEDGNVQSNSLAERLMQPEILGLLYSVLSWTVIAVLSLFILFLAYVFAVSVDHRIERAYTAQLEQ